MAYSELDYSYRPARVTLGKNVHQCWAFSLRSGRWHRTTVSNESVERETSAHRQAGIFFGQW